MHLSSETADAARNPGKTQKKSDARRRYQLEKESGHGSREEQRREYRSKEGKREGTERKTGERIAGANGGMLDGAIVP